MQECKIKDKSKPKNMKQKEIEQIVLDFMDGEEDGFKKNEHGNYMYHSTDKSQTINLKLYFEDLAEHVLDHLNIDIEY